MGSLYDKPFVNKSGETIPAYAVMQVDDTADAGGLSFYRCIKPAEGGKVYLLNGPRPVANDTRSMAASALAHLGLYALVEGATPTKNEEWGPKSGSWKLNKGDGYKGFFIVGGAQAGRVRVTGVSAGGAPGAASSASHMVALSEITKAKFQTFVLTGGVKVKAVEYGSGWATPYGLNNPYPNEVNFEPVDEESLLGYTEIKPVLLDLDGGESSSWATKVYNMVDQDIPNGANIQIKMINLGGTSYPFVDVENCK